MLNKIKEIMRNVEELTDNSVKCYLAGGYLRDVMNGLQPKDIDIMVVPNCHLYDSDDFNNDIENLEGYEVTKNLNDRCYYMSDMSDRNITGLLMGSLSDGTELQFIYYGDTHTQNYITHDMDINICQITMNKDGKIIETDAFVNGFATSNIEVLHEYKISRKKSRIARMLEKYPSFTSTPVE